jgi:hypothetical protein
VLLGHSSYTKPVSVNVNFKVQYTFSSSLAKYVLPGEKYRVRLWIIPFAEDPQVPGFRQNPRKGS